MKRRALNIRSEDAGHPFRKILPPALLVDGLTDGFAMEEAQPVKWWKSEDTHLFLMSFCAFFVVFYSFIA